MALEPAAYKWDETASQFAYCHMCKTLYTGFGGGAFICVHAVGPRGKLRHYRLKAHFARRHKDYGMRIKESE